MRVSRTLRIAISVAMSVGVVAGVAGLVAPAADAAAPTQAAGGEIVIGQINNETNPATPGAKISYSRETLNAWAKMVNANGGINGMKVVVKTEDDGNDPAKASAAMKKLIEEDNVVAIVGPNGTSTIATWSPIAKDAGVPVIGGGCYSQSENDNENFFCGTTTAILAGLKAQVALVKQEGGESFGITYASDIPAAAQAAPLFKALAENEYGIDWTEAVGTTNTQPDYTAACLTFKQSNTTDVGIEGAPLLQNLARDCGRQGYYPKYTSGDGQISQNSWLKNPNIKEAIAAVYSFPFMVTKGDTPEQTQSLKEYHAAMDKYAPKVLKGDYKQPSTQIWTAAKMFEKAATAGIPSGSTPSAAAVKQGLYTFQDETLGGLAPNPLTFTEGQPHPANPCWFFVQLKNGKLTAPNGMQTECSP